MSTDTLLTLLRQRLATIRERIEWNRQLQYVVEQEEYNQCREVEHWAAGGEVRALRCEQLFLAGLLEQIGTVET